jgi:uncharacterized protein
MDSALYVGRLRHRRFAPRWHEFSYPVFMAFLDINRLSEAMGVSPFSSYNRWNWASFNERDHFGDSTKPLRERLKEDAAAQGLELPDGQIFLLTQLRYFGYVFKPVSFFYCYDRSGRLALLMSEVNSTFGESHNYWLTPENARPSAAARRFTTAKKIHVSPFMGMHLDYDWIFTDPAERLVVHMNTVEESKAFFDATLQLERRLWSSRELFRALVSFPFVTLKVIAAIHWQALRLWLKKVPVFPHPAKLARQRLAVPSKGKMPE